MAKVVQLNLRKGSLSDQFRAFARKTIQENHLVTQEELCRLAKDRFKKKYLKGHFLGALILDSDIEFQKTEGNWIFVSQGVLSLVDQIWKQIQVRKAA